MPKIYLFVLSGVSARNPWLNKKNGLQNAMRRRIAQALSMAI